MNIKISSPLKKYHLRKMGSFFKFYFGGLYTRLDKHHSFLLGGGLTFSIFTCLLPFTLVIFSLLGILLEMKGIRFQIQLFIDTLIPYQSSSQFIKEFIFNRMDDFRFYKTITGFMGVFGLFFAASGLFSSMRTILNMVFRVTKGKNILIGKLRDFGMIILVVVLFLISVTLLPSLDVLVDTMDRFDFHYFLNLNVVYDFFASFIFSIISFLVIFGVFFMIYYLIPYERPRKRVATVSAFWAAILWEIAKQIFGYYIAHAVNLSRVYGTYLFIVVFAFWMYYSSLVFIVAAEIGQLFRERRGYFRTRKSKGHGLRERPENPFNEGK